MSDSTLKKGGASPPKPAGQESPVLPTATWGENCIGPKRFDHVRNERQRAADQIGRTMKAWRKASGGAVIHRKADAGGEKQASDEKQDAASAKEGGDEKKQDAAAEKKGGDEKMDAAPETQGGDEKQDAAAEKKGGDEKQDAAAENQGGDEKQDAAAEKKDGEKKKGAAEKEGSDEKNDAAEKGDAAPAEEAPPVARKVFLAPKPNAYNPATAQPQIEQQMRYYLNTFGLAGVDRSGDPSDVGMRICTAINNASNSLASTWFNTVRAGRVDAITGLAAATAAEREQLITYATARLSDLETEIVAAEFSNLQIPRTSFVPSPPGQKGCITYSGRRRRQ
jgi:hypothetical protein